MPHAIEYGELEVIVPNRNDADKTEVVMLIEHYQGFLRHGFLDTLVLILGARDFTDGVYIMP